MSADDERGALRRRLRETRRAVDPDVAAARAGAAAAILDDVARRESAACVGAYLAMDGELDPGPFVDRCHTTGRAVALPAIDGDVLRFVDVNPTTRFIPHERGMFEPDGGEPVALEDIDLLVLPAVGVDTDGTRLGFGGGYYDRTLGPLAAADRPLLVALVHPEQVLPRIERRPWDIPVDIIATPDGMTWTANRGSPALRRGDRDGDGNVGL